MASEPPHEVWAIGEAYEAYVAILDGAAPEAVVGVDRSRAFVRTASARAPDPRACFQIGDAQALPVQGERFDAVWRPFLGGQGPAPGYVASLRVGRLTALRERLRATLPWAADGSLRAPRAPGWRAAPGRLDDRRWTGSRRVADGCTVGPHSVMLSS